MEGSEAPTRTLSRDMKDAGWFPRTAAFATGIAAEVLVPAVLNPALREFSGKTVRQAAHSLVALGEIPAVAAVFAATNRPELAAGTYLAMQMANILTRISVRDKDTDTTLDRESIFVRTPTKAVALITEAFLPTILTYGRHITGEGYHKLHEIAFAAELSGIAAVTGSALFLHSPEVAVGGVAAYMGGRTLMLASEVSERNWPAFRRHVKSEAAELKSDLSATGTEIVSEFAYLGRFARSRTRRLVQFAKNHHPFHRNGGVS